MGASGDTGTAGMCERGRIFDAGFAVFCAVFRRGEQGFTNRDMASRDGFDAGMCWRGRFFFKIVGLRKNKEVSLW